METRFAYLSLLILLVHASNFQLCTCFGSELFLPFAKTRTSSLVRQAGFIPEVYDIPTGQKGYSVNLVRIVHPSIKRNLTAKKWPILFVHGLINNANCWLVMGYSGGKPQDWSEFDEAKLGQSELRSLIGKDVTARSLPFLLANFAYDVWVVNRRNTRDSRHASPKWTNKNDDLDTKQDRTSETNNKTISSEMMKLKQFQRENPDLSATGGLNTLDILASLMGKSTANKIHDFVSVHSNNNSYYKYSYDDQARFDLRAAIEFIRAKTRRAKVDIVGHSAGGLITLMMLATQPEMNSMINHAALLAPAVNLHYTAMKSKYLQLLEAFMVFISSGVGRVSPVDFLLPTFFNQIIPCLERTIRGKRCPIFIDEVLGLGSMQFDLSVILKEIPLAIDHSSFHELNQLIQSGHRNQISFFDFLDPEENLRAYGSLDVPQYNLTRVALNSMSIWQGNCDRLVNQFDTYTLLRALKNQWDYHFIGNASGRIQFNHMAFMFHSNVTNLLNIPLLKRIALARNSNSNSDN